MRRTLAFAASMLLLILASTTPSHAQATRTWVSGVGDDANPCSRTAPCKTFAGAISKTATNGEISVLDPGGFGAVTITKSISIVSDGGSGEGGVLATGTNGIIINSPTAIVNISGLMIEGAGTGQSGVRIIAAASVHIRDCVIRGFRGGGSQNSGIEIVTSNTTAVTVENTTISDNVRGIHIQPTGAGVANVVANDVVFSANSSYAFRVIGAGAVGWIGDSVIVHSNEALKTAAGGKIHSKGNNFLANNASNETFSDTLPLQ